MSEKLKLNSNHMRILSSTSKIVDNELQEIERILFAEKEDSKMNIVEKSFDKQMREKLLAQIKLLRNENLEMFDHFNLKGKTLTEKQMVYSKISYLWTILTDSRSKKLKSYGKLDDKSGAEIDGYIDRMLVEIEKMLKV